MANDIKSRVDMEKLQRELIDSQMKQQIFGGRRSGKSTVTATQQQLAAQMMSGKPIPTFEGELSARRGSAADGVVDDVLKKLKAGAYQ